AANSWTALLNASSPNRIICSRQSSLIVRTNLSAWAFKFGDRAGSFTDSIPCSASIVRNSRVQRIAIVNQVPFSFEESIEFIGHIASNLRHPQTIWPACDSSDLDTTRREFHKEENDKSF